MATYYIRKNNVISMVRGDTFSFNITLSDDEFPDEIYILSEDDKLFFALMEPNKSFEESLLIKEYTSEDVNTDGSITISLEDEDTLLLPPGKYFYTIKLETKEDSENNSTVTTVIPKTSFFIID